MANIKIIDNDYFADLEKSKETWKQNHDSVSNAEIQKLQAEELNLDTVSDNETYQNKKNELIKLFEERKKMEDKGVRSGDEYKANTEAIKQLREEIKDDLQKEIDFYENEVATLKNDKNNSINATLAEANQAEINNLNNLLNSKIGGFYADAEKYHQTQGNGSNCGAAAFTVSVNTLIGENKYDNVEVWSSPEFGSDSTVNVPGKGQAWLEANGLGNTIDCVDGSYINDTSALKTELEQGNVVVTSSGAGAPFIYNTSGTNYYGDGHFISVYKYEDGKFYVNDSARSDGDGVAYTEEQMQAWFDGRAGAHPAAVLSLK